MSRQRGVYKKYNQRALRQVAKLLEGVMDAQNLTQHKAADLIGCDANSISRWVRAQAPPGPEWAESLGRLTKISSAEMLKLILEAHKALPYDVVIIPKATGFEGSRRDERRDKILAVAASSSETENACGGESSGQDGNVSVKLAPAKQEPSKSRGTGAGPGPGPEPLGSGTGTPRAPLDESHNRSATKLSVQKAA